MSQETVRPSTFLQAEERIAESMPGYEPRPLQQQAAAAIEQCIANPGARLMLEASTGTGKSFAALIPAILSGKRTVFSTATKALQDQLTQKDLPFLQEHLGVPFTWAMLKGRSNYACHAALADPQQWEEHVSREQVEALLSAMEDPQRVGDYEDCNQILEQAGLPGLSEQQFAKIAVTEDNCPGRKQCPFGEVCRSELARDRAKSADVAVVNTALLLADASVAEKTGGAVSLIGPYEVQILDESHTLQESVTSAMASTVRQGTIPTLCRELGPFLAAHTPSYDPDSGLLLATDLERASREFWDTLPRVDTRGRFPKSDPVRLRRSWFADHFDQVAVLLDAVKFAEAAIRECNVPTADVQEYAKKVRLLKRCTSLAETITRWCLDEDSVTVRWVEFYQAGAGRNREWRSTIKTSPVDVAEGLRSMLWSRHSPESGEQVSTVLMSATLTSTGRDPFAFLRSTLGFEGCEQVRIGTPFDYPSQALTFLPSADTPSPKNYQEWSSYLPFAIDRLVEESGGGALLLFTSRRSMQNTYQALSSRLTARGINCYMQGQEGMSNRQVADAFRADTDSVLFGLRSFFAGVDFSGETCRLVVIDKLTFPVPTDPVFEARSELVESRGGRSFTDLSLPVMSLTLVQGYGRLIRSHSDYGVVAVLDSRLTSTRWGGTVARSLPDARQTSDLGDVRLFFEHWRTSRS